MISKTGSHALMALWALADLQPESYAGAGEVAQRIGAPPNYLGKLLQTLANAGLLESQKGRGGGFRLARDPGDISLLEILEPIEHVSRRSGCLLGRGSCMEDDPCPVHDRWKKVRQALMEFLRETTIADLAAQPVTAGPST